MPTCVVFLTITEIPVSATNQPVLLFSPLFIYTAIDIVIGVEYHSPFYFDSDSDVNSGEAVQQDDTRRFVRDIF